MRVIVLAIAGMAAAAAAPPTPPSTALSTAQAAVPAEMAAWAFPGRGKPAIAQGVAMVTLAGSTQCFAPARLRDMTHAIDWFPASHPALPAVVATGTDGAAACGFCHLPGGEGRPENASLAGLPADYIRHQVQAFASGARRAAVADWVPTNLMVAQAHHVSPAALRVAAAYFHRQRFVSRLTIVETATVPAPRAERFLFQPTRGGAAEPIGNRIIEAAPDMERFEKRDPTVPITAYVPPGSIERGKAVVARIGCPACHGEGMKTWGAGRSPSYVVRQLLAFKTGARHDAESPPMRAVAAQLTPRDMVAVAAYWGTLTP